MTVPTITVSPDGDYFRLMATSYLRTEPAGSRLFRSPPHPNVEWLHEDEATATTHAARLQAYLDDAYSGKAVKTKGREEKITEADSPMDLSNAVWNL